MYVIARMHTHTYVPNLFMNVIIMKLHKVAAERIIIQSKLSFIHSLLLLSMFIIVVYVFLLLSMYSYCSSMYS